MVKEGDTIYNKYTPERLESIIQKLNPQVSREQEESFKVLSEIIADTARLTLETLGQKPRIKHMISFNDLHKKAILYGHKSALNPAKSFRAEVDFHMVGDNVQTNHFVLDRNTGSGNFVGRLNVPFKPDEVLDSASIQNSAQRKADISRFVGEMVIAHLGANRSGIGHKEKIRQTAAMALDQVLSRNHQAPAIQSSKVSSTTTKSDFDALQNAIAQAISNTLDDLTQDYKSRRPKVTTSRKTNKNVTTLKFRSITKRMGGLVPIPSYHFTINFDTNPDVKFGVTKDYHDDWGSFNGVTVPLNEADMTVASSITPIIKEEIISYICRMMRNSGNLLDADNLTEAKRIKKSVTEHLNHALAAAFGGELTLENKPLELTKFDEDEANKRFREETNALKKAGRSDHYLLQTFGMAAGNKAGEDASIIAEWQIGRTLRLPSSLEKIRSIHDTLATFVDMDVHTRANQAGQLLSQMRSLQKTITRDQDILMNEAASIHGAKSLMSAHENVLQKYVQSFNAMRDGLVETFGEAAIEKRETAITTNLSAAQIHTGNQESIHERLNLKMLEQISDFSTHMSFLAKSMRDIVEETTLGTLLSEGQTIDDLSDSVIAQAGLSEARIGALKDMNRERLEQSVLSKIEDLREELAPMALQITNINDQLALADRTEERLRITDQSHDFDND